MLVVQLLYYCMDITIDTSALLAVLLNEKHKPTIIEATRGHDLQAPNSLDAEIGNALSAMFKRGRITLEQVTQVLKQFKEIPIRRTTLRLPKALELAIAHDIYAYDAYVLDCARQYRSPLISLDRRLVGIGHKMELHIIEV